MSICEFQSTNAAIADDFLGGRGGGGAWDLVVLIATIGNDTVHLAANEETPHLS